MVTSTVMIMTSEWIFPSKIWWFSTAMLGIARGYWKLLFGHSSCRNPMACLLASQGTYLHGAHASDPATGQPSPWPQWLSRSLRACWSLSMELCMRNRLQQWLSTLCILELLLNYYYLTIVVESHDVSINWNYWWWITCINLTYHDLSMFANGPILRCLVRMKGHGVHQGVLRLRRGKKNMSVPCGIENRSAIN